MSKDTSKKVDNAAKRPNRGSQPGDKKVNRHKRRGTGIQHNTPGSKSTDPSVGATRRARQRRWEQEQERLDAVTCEQEANQQFRTAVAEYAAEVINDYLTHLSATSKQAAIELLVHYVAGVNSTMHLVLRLKNARVAATERLGDTEQTSEGFKEAQSLIGTTRLELCKSKATSVA